MSKARDERELNADQRGLRTRQRHARESEQTQLKTVADLDRDDGDAVDQRERVERDAGGEPERAAFGREATRASASSRNGSPARAAGSSALIIGKLPNWDRSCGMDRRRLMPNPPPMPMMKKAGGPPIGTVHGFEQEQRRKLIAFGTDESVAAVDGYPVHGHLRHQHAELPTPPCGGVNS